MRIGIFLLALLATSLLDIMGVQGQTHPKAHKVAGSNLVWYGFTSPDDLSWPGFMQGWLGKVPIILDTDTVPGNMQPEGDGPLVKFSQTSASSYEFSNNSSAGVAMRGSSASNTPLAVAIALDTRYCSKVTMRWRVQSVTGYFGQINGVQCQFRVGRTGGWTNFQPPTEFRGTGAVNKYYGPVDLPSTLLNLPEVQIRWVLYEKTGNAPTQDYTCRFNVGDIEISGVKNNPPKPKADFSWDKEKPLSGDTLYFTDLSTGDPEVWAWDFGDGFGSALKDPWHQFADTGKYLVRLAVSNGFGWDSLTREIGIGLVSDTTDTTGGDTSTWVKLGRERPTLSIFPNPAHDRVLVTIPTEYSPTNLQLLNAQGALVSLFEPLPLQSEHLRLIQRPLPGLYYIRMQNQNFVHLYPLLIH